ncbi:MAG: hypothetical protein KAT06_09090 [Gammaproteobacteria bacterium]|nr:hypothetical protein [Gammaproteobacteria bacterium]
MPYGQEFDDIDEPTAEEFLNKKYNDVKNNPNFSNIEEFISEVGSLI